MDIFETSGYVEFVLEKWRWQGKSLASQKPAGRENILQ